MKNSIYLVTGANGHLGSTIIRFLSKKKVMIRGLLLPDTLTEAEAKNPGNEWLSYWIGDVCKPETLEDFFTVPKGMEPYVIHAAGIVDITEKVTPLLYEVNVNGTRNIIQCCQRYCVKRLLYVSSVHAIPVKQDFKVIREINFFSPELVDGAYAKTKAEATQAVLDAVHNGLDAVIVHPSGIIGPFDTSGNHLVQLVERFASGKLPACVHGGYDFVDVRDVALGCINALEKGKTGGCYILSNRHYEIRDLLLMTGRFSGPKSVMTLPVWIAKIPTFFGKFKTFFKKSNFSNKKSLFTAYSLSTLKSNDRFSHDKATSELNYRPRDILLTLRDTVHYYRKKQTPH